MNYEKTGQKVRIWFYGEKNTTKQWCKNCIYWSVWNIFSFRTKVKKNQQKFIASKACCA